LLERLLWMTGGAAAILIGCSMYTLGTLYPAVIGIIMAVAGSLVVVFAFLWGEELETDGKDKKG